jgi:hypothetical protein
MATPSHEVASSFGNRLALAQGAYFVAAGAWPILHLRSFYAVAGRKREGWLVKTVGTLIAVIGSALLRGARRSPVAPETAWLGVASAGALAGVDCIWVAAGRVPPVYLLDAAVELALLSAWARARRGGRWRNSRPADLAVSASAPGRERLDRGMAGLERAPGERV